MAKRGQLKCGVAAAVAAAAAAELASIDEGRAGQIEVGQLAEVTRRSAPDLRMKAKIVRIGVESYPVNDEHGTGYWQKIVFSGEKSRTADRQALARAKEMDGNADAATIWKETGWRMDKAGSWVYEISDRDAKITGMPDLTEVRPGEPIIVRLGALLDHPLLFKAYPELANTKVKVFNGALVKNQDDAREEYKATTTPAEDGEPATIEIAGRICDFLSTLVHKVQHLVEDYGDLNYGPETGSYDPRIGEARARNTERRLRMGDDLRRRRLPSTTCDTPQRLIRVSPDRVDNGP